MLKLRRMKSAVPLKLTKSPLYTYQHMRRMYNGCGIRRSLQIKQSFKTALKSPFSCQPYTAIPPPAALCAKALIAYSSFSTV